MYLMARRDMRLRIYRAGLTLTLMRRVTKIVDDI